MNQKPYLNDVQYKSDNVIGFLGGGINNVYPSQFIADDEVQDMYNFCLDSYPEIRTRIGRTMFKNPGIKGEVIHYFGVAGLNYLFYIQGDTLKDVDGNAISKGLTGTSYSHVYYKDGEHEYVIIYGNNQRPTRHQLPLSSFNTPEYVPEIVLEKLPENSSYEGEDVVTYEETITEVDENGEVIRKKKITKYKKITVEFEHMCYHKRKNVCLVWRYALLECSSKSYGLCDSS